MKIVEAFRLLAVPVGGALVFAIFVPVMTDFNLASVFVGLLCGFIGSMLIGIPLLLLGDWLFPDFKARHVLSSVIQVVVTYLCFSGFSPRLLMAAIVVGLALGVGYTVTDKALVRYAADKHSPQMSKVYVLGIPLCGGLPLAVIATWAFASPSEIVASLILSFLVGAGLSMLAGWPVLWLTERFLTTRWRYVIGGVITGLLLWLLFGVPGLRPTPVAQHMNFLMYQIKYGVLLYVLMGCVSGLLFTGFHWVYSRLSPRKENPLD